MRIDRRFFTSSALAAAVAPPALAQAPPRLPDDLRARITAAMARDRTPGCAIAVVKDGRTLAAEGLGLASIPFAAPVTERSLFHLGSIAKQFTAAEIVALAREGRIDLSHPIGRYVRDLPEALGAPPIRTLLSHTSGIPDYEGLPGFEGDRLIERAAFIRGVAAMPSDFPPGTAWKYSNSAYVFLGYLIADVTGQTYHEAVRARLLAPARFEEARFDDATAIIPGRVEPYVFEEDDIRHATQMDGDFSGWADGGLLMSARDAARWEIALQNGQIIPRQDFTLLTNAATMSTGRSCGYGMGWFIDRTHGRDIHHHSGSVPGFLAWYWRVPSLRLGAVIMVNVESGPAGRWLRQAVQELCEWAQPGSTFLSLQPVRDPDPALTQQTLALVMRGDAPIPRERLAPELAALLPDNTEIPKARTAPSAWDLVETFTESGGLVRRYRASYPDRVTHVCCAYDRSGRIYRVRTT